MSQVFDFTVRERSSGLSVNLKEEKQKPYQKKGKSLAGYYQRKEKKKKELWLMVDDVATPLSPALLCYLKTRQTMTCTLVYMGCPNLSRERRGGWAEAGGGKDNPFAA